MNAGSAPSALGQRATNISIARVENGWTINTSGPNPYYRQQEVSERYNPAVHDPFLNRTYVAGDDWTSVEEILLSIVDPQPDGV